MILQNEKADWKHLKFMHRNNFDNYQDQHLFPLSWLLSPWHGALTVLERKTGKDHYRKSSLLRNAAGRFVQYVHCKIEWPRGCTKLIALDWKQQLNTAKIDKERRMDGGRVMTVTPFRRWHGTCGCMKMEICGWKQLKWAVRWSTKVVTPWQDMFYHWEEKWDRGDAH